MPPRMPLFQCLRTPFFYPPPSCSVRAFSNTASNCSRSSTKDQRRRRQDPYAAEQARARKAANLSRQEVLRQERTESLGDPVRGTETAFVRSFDDPSLLDQSGGNRNGRQNFYMTQSEVDEGIERSKWLVSPPDDTQGKGSADDYTSSKSLETRTKEQEELQANAAEAVRRISAISLGSSKDRLRVNIQRCIETFGRHNTDSVLPPKAATALQLAANQPTKTPRMGPDTGSSEVQIAVLTAKIRTLADVLEKRGKKDKHNKRNLRLLVHKRQKLLQYLRKQDRGGPRWQHAIETLGLTEGTWKGEITLGR